LAGCLAALALLERRPDCPFLLVEGGQSFGGNHIWSFFDSDVRVEDRWLIEPLISARWEDHDIEFPRRRRTLGLPYNSIRSADLNCKMLDRLQPEHYRVGAPMASVGLDHIVLASGERIEAEGVIDARGTASLSGLDLAWQKFVGRTYRYSTPHGCPRPLVMDARVDQTRGYRFLYALPFTETELMVEDTYYSTSPTLDVPLLRGRIDSYLTGKGWQGGELAGEETGVLPVVLGGEVDSLWTGEPVPRLGVRGGFFHPTTGYSLPDAVSNAALLAGRGDFRTAALHAFYRDRARSLWSQRSFYRLLNRMLIRAAAPRDRYRVLEHFYRLPEARIARFYAGRSTLLDRLRILSGKPPVPIRIALAAIRGTAI
jgi:lycopene beta-cyclase